ncbi:MAG: polysaccharide deacetylase family protein [Nitrospira sp.]|nr:polysaccharide deacetylase family protein [Nitrospira sp.]
MDVYSRILDLFEKHRFKATFAFVSALCMDAEELQGMLAGVELRYSGRNWLATPLDEIACGAVDGWCVPELLERVRSRGVHHICTHGGTHLPYSNDATPQEAVTWDIDFARRHFERLKLGWGGIVFPRNVTGHLETLAGSGIAFYRSMDRAEQVGGKVGKAIRLANEYVSADRFGLRLVGDREGNLPAALSPGKFINARIGFRRHVPSNMTLHRVETMLKLACSHNRILHLYTHPHNFINDGEMFRKLECILSKAGSLVRDGRLDVMTMEDEFNDASRAA